MPRTRLLLSIILFATLAAPAFARQLVLTPQQAHQLGIRTVSAAPAQVRTVASVLGRVVPAPGARLPVAAPFAGTVKTLVRLEGQQVKKGDGLLVIVSTDMRDAQAAYESARAHARTARVAANRARLLVAEGIAAQSRAEEAEAQAAAAAARFAALQSTMGRAEHTGNGEYRLTAPADGRIAAIFVSAGEQVGAMQPVVTLDTGDGLWVEAALPATAIGQVAAGDRASVEGGVHGTPITGTVMAAGASIDARTRSATVRVRLDGAPSLVVGQTVRLALTGGALAGSLAVPRAAVTDLNGDHVVFVAAKDGFAVVPVQLAARGPMLATITGPLKAGDRVAIAGVTELKAMALRE